MDHARNISPDVPLRGRVGGGNLEVSGPDAQTRPLLSALKATGARMVRINTYSWRSASGRPTPETADAAIATAFRNGLTPVLLLEYYGNYERLHPPQPIGSYQEWRAIGAAVATRFRPGGTWSQTHGAGNWGVRVFAAINEPDIENLIAKPAYHDALAGLADGVHAVDASLKVVPGGFATCNSAGDPALRGYGPAIADLLNDGRLDGIDLHMYYHDRWFPIAKGRHFSAQRCFDAVKDTAGVSRDIRYYTTEFNVAASGKDGAVADGPQAAMEFVTGFWDEIGVVDGTDHPVTAVALPWGLNLSVGPAQPEYALTESVSPWRGDPRGEALRMLLRLAGDMHLTRADPRHAGEYELADATARLIVWQDRPGWTTHQGDSFQLRLADDEHRAELWTAAGMVRELDCRPGTVCDVTGLSPGQTYMFRVEH